MPFINGYNFNEHRIAPNRDHSIRRWGNVFRFEVRQGERASFDDSTRDRCEFIGSGPGFSSPTGEMWFSYAMRLEPGAANGAQWMVLGQIHASDSLSGANPWFACELTGDTWKITSKASTTPAGSFNSGSQTVHFQQVLVRGRWYRIVLRVKAGGGGDGILQAWLDGVQVVNKNPTAIGYTADTGPYYKHGIYRAAHSGTFAVSYANMEISRTSLISRVTAPPIIGAAL